MKQLIPAALILLLSLFVPQAPAQVQLNDSAKISLLTSSPWYGAVYAYFGHTAIHVQDDSTGVNAVFNYGYFDSSQPNFIYRFVRGETDYILGVTTYEDFLWEYGYKGQEVVVQELNLSPEKKQQLYEALSLNALPENREYRYNFFYDNCATRPRNMVEKYTNGVINYPPTPQEQTYRDLLHECVSANPWLLFGIDLVIGSEADRTIDVREKMFIPRYLMDSFDGAIVQENDTLRYPLVQSRHVALERNVEKNHPNTATLFTPFVTAIVLLLLTLLISLFQLIKRYTTKFTLLYDTLLFGLVGLGGVVLSFLMFFSVHPAMIPNWNFVWLNIFAFVAAFLFWVKSAKNVVYFYHFINFAVLTLFLLFWWLIPQQLPTATIPLAMSLWVRSGTTLFIWRKKRRDKKRFKSSSYYKAGWGQ
ncbi:MAG: DUF4105 domain-containing protein [Proteiniphilum sp.]|jgi:hypothetical protein|nr:DUF4105 domain-containing protein [Proteiniphilum sp.]NCB24847.1 DUF4105 domain-containing protein [Bacteroidia bacterium]HBX20316.1 hypothetical protein [Porphyromonadaceae bacterium]MDD2938949.1 DUF4105 domain-containing protein [Proteiniphilum sp.]MDD3076310.1 DUF4105 domain-containing protein [Proteiniphilum sp.]